MEEEVQDDEKTSFNSSIDSDLELSFEKELKHFNLLKAYRIGRGRAEAIGQVFDPDEFIQWVMNSKRPTLWIMLFKTAENITIFRKIANSENEVRKREQEKEIYRRRSKMSIFNMREPVYGAITNDSYDRAVDILLYDTEYQSQWPRLAFDKMFPDPAILKDDAYVQLPEGGAQTFMLRAMEYEPCFFPVPVDLRSTNHMLIERETVCRSINKEARLSEPTFVFEAPQWYNFFGNHDPTLEKALQTLRSRREEELTEAGVDDIVWILLNLTPERDRWWNMYKNTHYLHVLHKRIMARDINSPFMLFIIRKGLHLHSDPVLAEPAESVDLVKELDDMLEILHSHFNVLNVYERTTMVTKVLDYLCPGISEIYPTIKEPKQPPPPPPEPPKQEVKKTRGAKSKEKVVKTPKKEEKKPKKQVKRTSRKK